MSLAAGSRIGVYEIVAAIGAGGMGEVYRAHDSKLRRDIALKVLSPQFASDPDRLARFEREAHAVASLSHPNILAIHDFGRDSGVTYAAMELLEGQSLRQAIANGPLPRRKALDYAGQIARALDAAHARGIVHRDLKPENIFITTGAQVKVLDFGLAANPATTVAGTAQTTIGAGTLAGTVMGTPGYMSPEQVRGETADHRSDIFSFGCVLYEMVSGTRAFTGESSIDTLHATLRDEPRDLATLTNAPAALTRLVERCLEKDRAERMQSARDLVFALDTVTADDGAAGSAAGRRGAGDDTSVGAMPRASRRRSVIGWLVAAAAIAASLVAWIALRGGPAGVSAAASARDVRHGIAVLPFENLAPEDQAYFAAGVTEEVTLQIAKMSAVRVMSRAAVARFKDPTSELAAMARELGIGAVLTGSVRHADNRVRIGVQLLAAPSGETLWSEQYDGDVRKVLDVQSTVALGVARALQASLAPGERARIERPPTGNAEAYELFLKARPLPRGNHESNVEGIKLLEQAVALDPRFALGYATLAQRYSFLGERTTRADLERGVAAARTAIQIDPELARAHSALGENLMWLGRIDEARNALQRATVLDPNFPGAMMDLSVLETNAGRLDQALYWAKRAFTYGPNLPVSYYQVSVPLSWLDNDITARWAEAGARRFQPPNATALRLQYMLAVTEWRNGHSDAALNRMRQVAAAAPKNTEAQTAFVELTVLAGAPDAAEHLDRVIGDGFGGAIGFYSPYTPRVGRAFLYMNAGNRPAAMPLVDEALTSNREAIESGDRSYLKLMENAALYLMKSDRGAALDSLDAGIHAGWKDALFLERDPLLAGLRNEPRFHSIKQRIEREVAEMRARADFSSLDEWAGTKVTGK